jgi:hypothetical protein
MQNELDEALEKVEKILESAFGIIKHAHEYYKHMTTLNTGAILIIIGLLEGVFEEPKGKFFVIISICCFAISLISASLSLRLLVQSRISFSSMYMSISRLTKENFNEFENKYKNQIDSLGRKLEIAEPITLYGFLFGIAMFLVFTIINLID